MQVVSLKYCVCAALTTFLFQAHAQGTFQVTHGKCSPNASQIIASTFICIESLSQEQQKQLSQMKAALEQIAKAGGPIQQKILLRLHTIATESGRKLEDLTALYLETQKAVSNITPQLNRIEDAISDLSSRYYIVTIAPATPVPDLDPPVTVRHLNLSPSRTENGNLSAASGTGGTADFIARSKCKELKFLPDLQIKHLDLLELVANTESVDCKEKQYWYDTMPSMTESQIARLREILQTERRQLEELYLKYQAEIKCLNEKHSLQWNILEAKKRDSENFAHAIDVQRAAVEMLESEACSVVESSDAAKVIDSLKGTEIVVLAAEPARAHLLSRLYSTKGHRNDAARVALMRIAYERDPDNWDYFSDYLRHFAEARNWTQILGMTRSAIGRNLMPELRVYSERHMGRKLWIYWNYLNSATELAVKADIANAAIVGYNLTRMLLERNPDQYLLYRLAFFSGHIWRSDAISHDLKDKHFAAIQEAAETLYKSSKLSSTEFASTMLALSWYCLVARAPDAALRAAEIGLKVSPTYLDLETNRAHALMLTGRRDAGVSIYRANSEAKLSDGRAWRETVVDDFEKLGKLGVEIVPRDQYLAVFSTH